MKDISPPLDNSFSHIAHRGHGETPNWGTIMSEDRYIGIYILTCLSEYLYNFISTSSFSYH
jgi:hypothetical protein